MDNIKLRNVKNDDLNYFFAHQQDMQAQHMAAFVSKDPSDRAAFDDHWGRILNNSEVIMRTIVYNGEIAGHVGKFVMFNEPEITYWIGKEFWGKGIATQALKLFLEEVAI